MAATGKFKIEWHGEAVLREIRAISDEQTKEAAQRIEKRLNKYVPARLKEYPPSRTSASKHQRRSRGMLRSTIRVSKSKFKGGGYITLVGDANAYYAYWVEKGTVFTFRQKFGRRGDQYMKRAANLERARFIRNFKKSVGGV